MYIQISKQKGRYKMANYDGNRIDEYRLMLMRDDYEKRGLSLEMLSVKYMENIDLIRKHSRAEKWKHLVAPLRNSKGFERVYDGALKYKKGSTIQKKIDILAGMTSEDFLKKWKCSMSEFYRINRSVRDIQIERSEALMNNIAVKMYKDAEDRLLELQKKKKQLELEFLAGDGLDKKEVELIKAKLEAIQIMEQDIKYNARIISDSKAAFLEGKLVDESFKKRDIKIAEERLKMDKAKNQQEASVQENELVGLLKNIVPSSSYSSTNKTPEVFSAEKNKKARRNKKVGNNSGKR